MYQSTTTFTVPSGESASSAIDSRRLVLGAIGFAGAVTSSTFRIEGRAAEASGWLPIADELGIIRTWSVPAGGAGIVPIDPTVTAGFAEQRRAGAPVVGLPGALSGAHVVGLPGIRQTYGGAAPLNGTAEGADSADLPLVSAGAEGFLRIPGDGVATYATLAGIAVGSGDLVARYRMRAADFTPGFTSAAAHNGLFFWALSAGLVAYSWNGTGWETLSISGSIPSSFDGTDLDIELSRPQASGSVWTARYRVADFAEDLWSDASPWTTLGTSAASSVALTATGSGSVVHGSPSTANLTVRRYYRSAWRRGGTTVYDSDISGFGALTDAGTGEPPLIVPPYHAYAVPSGAGGKRMSLPALAGVGLDGKRLFIAVVPADGANSGRVWSSISTTSTNGINLYWDDATNRFLLQLREGGSAVLAAGPVASPTFGQPLVLMAEQAGTVMRLEWVQNGGTWQAATADRGSAIAAGDSFTFGAMGDGSLATRGTFGGPGPFAVVAPSSADKDTIATMMGVTPA